MEDLGWVPASERREKVHESVPRSCDILSWGMTLPIALGLSCFLGEGEIFIAKAWIQIMHKPLEKCLGSKGGSKTVFFFFKAGSLCSPG